MARTHQAVLTAAVDEVTTTASVSVVAACALVGIARSTYYRLTRRYAHYRRVPTPIPHRERTQPAALTADERRRILDVVTDEMRRMRVALASRGFTARNPLHWPVLARSAGALFIRSYERGERVHLAMLSRGGSS